MSLENQEIDIYWTTDDIAKRHKKTRNTIFRWIRKEFRGFPKPAIYNHGAPNLWLKEDILKWEATLNTKCF